MVGRQVCHQRLCNESLGMPDLESLARWKVSFSSVDPYERYGVETESEERLSSPEVQPEKPRGEASFFTECRKALCNLPESNDLSQSRKELFRDGGVRFKSARGATQLIAGWDLLPMELGARFELLEQQSSCSLCSSLGTRCPTTAGLGGHAWLRWQWHWSRGNSFARYLLLLTDPPVLESCQGVDGPHWSQIVLFYVGYVVIFFLWASA